MCPKVFIRHVYITNNHFLPKKEICLNEKSLIIHLIKTFCTSK